MAIPADHNVIVHLVPSRVKQATFFQGACRSAAGWFVDLMTETVARRCYQATDFCQCIMAEVSRPDTSTNTLSCAIILSASTFFPCTASCST